MASETRRFVGLDVHHTYLVMAAVDKQQQVLVASRRVNYQARPDWIQLYLQPTDVVVLEACSNAWCMYDLLSPHVAQVIVAHAAHVKLIASSLVKTDKRDALVLARLLAADLIPAVWVPPVHVRELRTLIHHRRGMVEQRSAVKARLHAVLRRHNLTAPSDYLDAHKYRAWWEALSLDTSDRLAVRQNLALLDHLSAAIDEVERSLAQRSVSDTWCHSAACLLQLPGLGLVNAMTVLSAIGDITRFPSAKKLVGYSGLGARIHSSGQVHRSGGITKTGRTELRAILVEAAWVAVQHDAFWRQQFEALAARRGRLRAIVAVARKLLVVIWHVLTRQEADRQADPQAVAARFMRWGAYHQVASSLGLKRTAFVRRELDRLQLGKEVTHLPFSGRVNALPPTGSIPLAS